MDDMIAGGMPPAIIFSDYLVCVLDLLCARR